MIEKIPDIYICIYEDNSNDQTPLLLEQLKAKYPFNINVLCEKIDWFSKSTARTWDGRSSRIECIAHARNNVMQLLEEKGMGKNEDDVCIMIDTDFKNTDKMPNIERIVYWAKNFPKDVDALFANGKDVHGLYYDIFAYRDQNFPFDYDIFGQKNHTPLESMKHQVCKQYITNRQERTQVFSAFGGIGIYRASSIIGSRYCAYPTQTLDSFYRSFMEKYPDHYMVKVVKASQASFEYDYHGCTLGTRWFGPGGFFYYNCWNFNVPTICEHINFHLEMIKKGHDRLFIEPSLSYTWEG
jgi:hypothetical protein